MIEDQPHPGDPEFRLSRYVDGDLTEAERRELEKALRDDPGLVRLLEAYRRTDELVKSLRERGPELDWEHFAEEVRRRRQATAAHRPQRMLYRLYVPLAAAAAIALVCTAYLRFRGESAAPSRPAPTVMVQVDRPGGATGLRPGERIVEVRPDRIPPSGFSAAPPSGQVYAIATAGAAPFDRSGSAAEENPYF